MAKKIQDPNYHWVIEHNKIIYLYKKNILFQDSLDHWHNGICRLLKVSEDEAKNWIEHCFVNSKNFDIKKFLEKSNEFFKCKIEFYDINKNLLIYANQVENNHQFYIAGHIGSDHAQLIDVSTNSPASMIEYSKDYFEHGTNSRKGYGDFLAQSTWRIEKAHRYYNLVIENINLSNSKFNECLNVLDVGSGYGFMRIPYEENGHVTTGIEISDYAAEIAKREYKLETIVGDISALPKGNEFDLILCFDIIEHIEKPRQFIKQVSEKLKSGGYLVIRTPNLQSLEAKVFGDKFHSFKLEHLNYFSVKSLTYVFMDLDFEIIFIKTTSHLFDGFKGIDTNSIEKSHLGSDIFCIIRKK